MRKDVFEKFVQIEGEISAETPAEVGRYIKRKILYGRRDGLDLPQEKRSRLTKLKKKEQSLCIEFGNALGEENTKLTFTRDELAGCPEDFIDGLEQTGDRTYEVSLKYPHYIPIMQKASNPKTREKMKMAFDSRCKDANEARLKEIVRIRHEKAKLLNYDSHADYQLEIKMAGSAAKVSEFLNGISTKMQEPLHRERKRMLELKKEECQKLQLEYDGHLDPWDIQYYSGKVNEMDYSVDHQVIKKYLPLTAVKTGILQLYQKLLSLKFRKIESEDAWHQDVEMYSVEDKDTVKLMGYFYLDLHPRDGKYGHAAVFGLQPGCLRQINIWKIERQVAMAAMVANFTGPTKAQPEAYLMHSEVETFFHEFGHLMHQICAQANTVMFSGTNVESDFVECPSQMLENWVWTSEGLGALMDSSGQRMPDHLLQSLLKSRFAMVGMEKMGQIVYAKFDQAIHTDGWQDEPNQVFLELYESECGIKQDPSTCKPASFAHIVGGYDAAYYGYLWSEVYSADLFETRFKHASDGGCLSETVGRDYRKKILQPGGTKDAKVMLHEFLGREPSDEAFFKRIGCRSSSGACRGRYPTNRMDPSPY